MPRTEAGKRLLEQNLYGRAPGEEDYYYTVDIEPAIDAIEAEARNEWAGASLEQGRSEGAAAEKARIRAAVEAMPTARIISQWDLISRRAVLALIDADA